MTDVSESLQPARASRVTFPDFLITTPLLYCGHYTCPEPGTGLTPRAARAVMTAYCLTLFYASSIRESVYHPGATEIALMQMSVARSVRPYVLPAPSDHIMLAANGLGGLEATRDDRDLLTLRRRRPAPTCSGSRLFTKAIWHVSPPPSSFSLFCSGKTSSLDAVNRHTPPGSRPKGSTPVPVLGATNHNRAALSDYHSTSTNIQRQHHLSASINEGVGEGGNRRQRGNQLTNGRRYPATRLPFLPL